MIFHLYGQKLLVMFLLSSLYNQKLDVSLEMQMNTENSLSHQNTVWKFQGQTCFIFFM